jgi:predicted transcriptional regulator
MGITHVMYKANTDWTHVTNELSALVQRGLIVMISDNPKRKIYKITDTGLQTITDIKSAWDALAD